MALRKQGNTYYVYFRDIGGKIKIRTLKTSDKTEAERLHSQFMDLLHAQRVKANMMRNFPELGEMKSLVAPSSHSRACQIARAGGLKLTDMVKEAEKVRPVPERSKAILEKYIEKTGFTYASQATPKNCLEYLDKEYGDGNGKGYNNAKCALNALWKATLVQSGISSSPWQTVPNRLIKQENIEHHRPLTSEEFYKAFEKCSEPYKTASLISWYTGLRKETCFRLAWEHINAEDQSITIMPGKTARFGRKVYIPIHANLWQHLLALPRPGDDKTPILSQWDEPKHCPGVKDKTYYAGLLFSLGILDNADGKASFHSIRASFITRCDEAGISRKAIKGVVGHTSDEVTDLYSQDKETAKQILKLS